MSHHNYKPHPYSGFLYFIFLVKVLLIKRGEGPYLNYWALPGDLINPQESIDQSVIRVLNDLTGLSDVYLNQVKTFGDVGRHPLGRVFTVAYYSLIKISDYELNPSSFAVEAKWHSVKRYQTRL